MRRWREWARSLVVVGIAGGVVGFVGCSFTVDTSPLNNSECAKGKKSCAVAGKMTCVASDDPDYGCGNPNVCDSCGSLGFRNGVPTCNPVTQRCAVASCDTGYRHCVNAGDETGGCETTTATNKANCGTCGNVCPDKPNSTGVCINSVCQLQCAQGFFDCNKMAGDGCECQSPKACVGSVCM